MVTKDLWVTFSGTHIEYMRMWNALYRSLVGKLLVPSHVLLPVVLKYMGDSGLTGFVVTCFIDMLGMRLHTKLLAVEVYAAGVHSLSCSPSPIQSLRWSARRPPYHQVYHQHPLSLTLNYCQSSLTLLELEFQSGLLAYSESAILKYQNSKYEN